MAVCQKCMEIVQVFGFSFRSGAYTALAYVSFWSSECDLWTIPVLFFEIIELLVVIRIIHSPNNVKLLHKKYKYDWTLTDQV